MTSTTEDPVVSISSRLPHTYVFVPKGNAYITGNCRKQTRSQGKKVYVVHNAKHQPIGIRVPYSVYENVLKRDKETKESRAKAVEKKDDKKKADFQKSIVSQFPQMPEKELESVVQRALMKYSKRVGRTGKLNLAEKALLAVRAHIRHRHTDYEKMLANGSTKDSARGQIYEAVDEVATKWGWKLKPTRERERTCARKATCSANDVTKASTLRILREKKSMKRQRKE